MRKIVAAILLCLLMASTFSINVGATQGKPIHFAIDAKAAILMEAASGQVICEQNADEKLDMAGAIKAMTALVYIEAIENGAASLTDSASISPAAARAGGMSAFLGSGETYTVEQLMKAMMQVSANDATIALAEKLSGNQESILAKMNDKATALKISPTFTNITGHNANGQSMSARDAATIARELVKHDKIMGWSKPYMENIQHPGGRSTELTNPNKLVRFYDGCDGLTTGSNREAGYSGIITAKRGNSRYIAVVIGAKNSNGRAEIAKQLLDYAFAEFAPITVIEEGKGVAKDVKVSGGTQKTIHGIAGEKLVLLLPKGSEKQIEKTPQLDGEEIAAPINKGDKIGELIVSLDGKELGRVPIVANDSVEAAAFGAGFRRIVLDFLNR